MLCYAIRSVGIKNTFIPPSRSIFDHHTVLSTMYSFNDTVHSSIGSSEKSARLSAPQTDHRFLSLLLRNPFALISSELLLRGSDPPSLSSPFCFDSSSSIKAASSASGVSSIVSNELMDGDRDRIDVGVLGILDAELNE
jgi:hypothetical protein